MTIALQRPTVISIDKPLFQVRISTCSRGHLGIYMAVDEKRQDERNGLASRMGARHAVETDRDTVAVCDDTAIAGSFHESSVASTPAASLVYPSPWRIKASTLWFVLYPLNGQGQERIGAHTVVSVQADMLPWYERT